MFQDLLFAYSTSSSTFERSIWNKEEISQSRLCILSTWDDVIQSEQSSRKKMASPAAVLLGPCNSSSTHMLEGCSTRFGAGGWRPSLYLLDINAPELPGGDCGDAMATSITLACALVLCICESGIQPLSLEVFKTCVGKLLNSPVWFQSWPCFGQGLGLDTLLRGVRTCIILLSSEQLHRFMGQKPTGTVWESGL